MINDGHAPLGAFTSALKRMLSQTTTTSVTWPDDIEPADWYLQDAPWNVINSERVFVWNDPEHTRERAAALLGPRFDFQQWLEELPPVDHYLIIRRRP